MTQPIDKKSAFTILEVIIVVIIIGVLASLALPKFSKSIEHSRATEALNLISSIRVNIERCYVNTRDYGSCGNTGPNGWSNLGMADPEQSPNNHFIYTVDGLLGAYRITAKRNTYELIAPASAVPSGIPDCGVGPGINIGGGVSQIFFCNQDGKISGNGIYSDL